MSSKAYAQIAGAIDADRARFGLPETIVAEFPRNAVEITRVARSGQLVQISTRGPSKAHADDYEQTAYECMIDHLPKLIEALQKAHAIGTAPTTSTRTLN